MVKMIKKQKTQKFEIKNVEDSSDIQCPYCQAELGVSQTLNLEYLDGETIIINCKSCKKEYQIMIMRPLEYLVGRKEDF